MVSLKSWSFEGDDRIRLVGRDNYYGGGQWRWLHFRADNVLGEQPTFRISANFAGGANRLANHRMVYSYDNQTWQFFDDNRVTPANRYEFSNEMPFSDDTVYVAYAFPYSYDASVLHTANTLATPWAEPTLSANTEGVIGQSPGGIDDLGRTVLSRDLFGYRITNPATDRLDQAKRKVVIASGLHANETLGTHTFEGLINWLVSSDPRAIRLRNVAEFYAYPILNPDGRFAGNNRSTVETVGRDPNGFWSPSLWATHEDIRVSGEAMIADTKSTLGDTDVFIDFHSTIPAFPNDDFGFLEFEQGDHQSDFWVELKRLQPNVRDVDSTSTTWTTANFSESFLNAAVDITFETQFGFDRPLEYYHTLGENFGIAFHNAWVGRPLCDFDESESCDIADVDQLISAIARGEEDIAYDLTGDGQLTLADRDEWLLLAAADGGLTRRFSNGDTNLDGLVNAIDLNHLGRHWLTDGATWGKGDFNGDGFANQLDLNALALSWQELILAPSPVPEPAISWLWLAGLMLIFFNQHKIHGHLPRHVSPAGAATLRQGRRRLRICLRHIFAQLP